MLQLHKMVPVLTLVTLFGEGGKWARVRPLRHDPTRYRVLDSNCGLKPDLVVCAESPIHVNEACELVDKSLVRTRVQPQDLHVIYEGFQLSFESYCRARYAAHLRRMKGDKAVARMLARSVEGSWRHAEIISNANPKPLAFPRELVQRLSDEMDDAAPAAPLAPAA